MVGESELDPDEYVLRRVRSVHYDPETGESSFRAFRPLKSDTDGLSVWRENACSIEWVASSGRQKHGYYVAAIRVADLVAEGLDLKETDSDQGPGHYIIPELNYDQRKSDQSEEYQHVLAGMCKMHDPLGLKDK